MSVQGFLNFEMVTWALQRYGDFEY